jgi:hypothetical protein
MFADVIITGTLLVVLAKTTAGMTAWRVSGDMLRDLLRYALPHVPHGLLTQITSVADRFVLVMFMPLSSVGLYQIAGTIAGVIKFYPVAFEAAWVPFAFDSLKRRDAPVLFARMEPTRLPCSSWPAWPPRGWRPLPWRSCCPLSISPWRRSSRFSLPAWPFSRSLGS